MKMLCLCLYLGRRLMAKMKPARKKKLLRRRKLLCARRRSEAAEAVTGRQPTKEHQPAK